MPSFSTNAWCSIFLWSYWRSLLDLDYVPAIPQTTECQIYLQTILLHLAVLFGELFPQKCKHRYPLPSMGISTRVGCIQDTKMIHARLKSKQLDELKRFALSKIRSDVRQTCPWKVFKPLLIMYFQFRTYSLPMCLLGGYMVLVFALYVLEPGCPRVSSS